MTSDADFEDDWREVITFDDEHVTGPTPVIKRTGEPIVEIVERVLQAGKWDVESEPDLAPLLELAAELLEDDAVLNWMTREIAMESEDDDARAVRDCFMAFQGALFEGDLEEMAALLDDHSRRVLLKYRELAVAGERALPGSTTPTIDGICAGIFGKVFAPDLLASMSESEVISFSVNHLFSGPEGFGQFYIGCIETDGDEASAELFAGDTALPLNLAFSREDDGAWRVGIVSMLPIVESTYNAIAIQQGMTPEQFIDAYIDEAGAPGQN
jgi:hypothetical protein